MYYCCWFLLEPVSKTNNYNNVPAAAGQEKVERLAKPVKRPESEILNLSPKLLLLLQLASGRRWHLDGSSQHGKGHRNWTGFDPAYYLKRGPAHISIRKCALVPVVLCHPKS